jgi:C4-dicarboxylate-specific signal transduction histidine kinase
VTWQAAAAMFVIPLQAAVIVALLVYLVRRRRLEASLKESEERVALATLPDNLGVWRWNGVDGELWASEHFRKIVDLPPAVRLTMAELRERIHADDRFSFDQLFVASDGAEVLDADFRIRRGDGEVRWLVSKVRPWRDVRGRVRRVSGVTIDVTDRRLADAESQHQRQQLAHLTRVAILGQLSGALAHELNQPLTSILSNAQAAQHFLERDPVDLKEVRDILEDIVNDDKRAGEVIRRLRAMLKRGETQMQQLDVGQVVREVLALAHSDLVVRQVEVTAVIGNGLPAVPGDRVQIQQVLLNLLLNASEAMVSSPRRDRHLEIFVAHEGRAVHVKVSDRGTGIAEGHLESIFDAFYTTKSNGLGLGLSICRSIISAHGGRLWATHNEGSGSTFHFTLPALLPASVVGMRS